MDFFNPIAIAAEQLRSSQYWLQSIHTEIRELMVWIIVAMVAAFTFGILAYVFRKNKLLQSVAFYLSLIAIAVAIGLILGSSLGYVHARGVAIPPIAVLGNKPSCSKLREGF